MRSVSLRHFIHTGVATLVFGLIFSLTFIPPRAEAIPSRDGWKTLEVREAPTANPSTGLALWYSGATSPRNDSRLDYTLEYLPLGLNTVINRESHYDWSALEEALNNISNRGHQAIIRFYIDNPGEDSALPSYLLDSTINRSRRDPQLHKNNPLSFSPDYNDPRISALMLDFISAFSRYDGDPRISVIQAGLWGYWGENHTYSDAIPNARTHWSPSVSLQQRIARAWDDSFSTTTIQMRYPDKGDAGLDVGYHDDMIGLNTLTGADSAARSGRKPSWHFLSRMDRAGTNQAWTTRMIGGEIAPEIQRCVFFDPSSRCPGYDAGRREGYDYDVFTAIDSAHISYALAAQGLREGFGSWEEWNGARLASARMGYTLSVSQVRTARSGNTFSADMRITNSGVAPFYMNAPLEVAIIDTQGRVITSAPAWNTNREGYGTGVRGLQPGETRWIYGEVTLPEDTSESFSLAFRVVSPLESVVGERAHPVVLANAATSPAGRGFITVD